MPCALGDNQHIFSIFPFIWYYTGQHKSLHSFSKSLQNSWNYNSLFFTCHCLLSSDFCSSVTGLSACSCVVSHYMPLGDRLLQKPTRSCFTTVGKTKKKKHRICTRRSRILKGRGGGDPQVCWPQWDGLTKEASIVSSANLFKEKHWLNNRIQGHSFSYNWITKITITSRFTKKKSIINFVT